ncbi:hypothetical protein Rcae01_05617 [Novipirellula caenicola]|uniref:Uncharacterized protein n=1 Tax=Novipirellula caenicola TaxID=1536901 RepID=A0ABP9VZG8_9BACT
MHLSWTKRLAIYWFDPNAASHWRVLLREVISQKDYLTEYRLAKRCHMQGLLGGRTEDAFEFGGSQVL